MVGADGEKNSSGHGVGLCIISGRQECADPRDRVYRLQRLLNLRLRISVDYAVTPEQVLQCVLRTAVDNLYWDAVTEFLYTVKNTL
jgi:hypothetical protein